MERVVINKVFRKDYEPNWAKSPQDATHFNPIRGYPDWYKLDGFTVWAFVAGQWMESGSFERFEFNVRDLAPKSTTATLDLKHYNEDFSPRMCPKCNGTEFEEKTKDSMDSHILEYEVVCKYCHYVCGYWAHGHFDSEFAMLEVGR